MMSCYVLYDDIIINSYIFINYSMLLVLTLE